MKRFFSLSILLFALFSFSAHANSTDPNDVKRGTISGRVLDAKLKQPLPYVNVIIKNTKGETLTGGITLDDGSFKVEKIEEGNITVSIQYIGYKTYNKTVALKKGNYKVYLGDIYLEEALESLEAVTVVAEVSTIQQKVDRKVITVGKDLTTAGPTASDIMNNLPSVNVDQQTGNISLRGNENVRVMVDGKLSNVPVAQLLRQIPSTSIKSIELITNPSAKYNPEGMSGIINIKLHKNTQIGFNGNLNVGVTKEIFAKFNSSIDMNYRNGKFNFYANYGNNIGKYDNFGNINRLDDDSRQDFKFGNDNKSHLYKFGVDFYMNDKNTISVFTNQNTFDGNGFGNTLIAFPGSINQTQLFSNVTDNISSQYNLAYKHIFNEEEDETLDVEIDHNSFENDEIANFNFRNFSFPPNYVDMVDTKRDQTFINVDYVKPLNETSKLEAGLEARFFNSDVNYSSTGQTFDGQGNVIATPSTDFEYNRDIFSAYVTFAKTINEKWNYQIGARFEQVIEEADALQFFTDNTTTSIPFENDYFQVYPSIFVSFKASDKNTYQFSASRRVDRPGLQQVNPIREWATPRVSSFGNPQLFPQFTNSVELNYTRKLKKGSVTGGMFFRLIEDNINRFVRVDRNNIPAGNAILTFDNFDNTTAYGVELSSNYRPTKWWSLNGSFDLYSQEQRGITEIIDTDDLPNATEADIVTQNTKVDNLVWNLRLFNNFKASKKLSFSLFTMYRGKEKGIQFTREPMFMLNTGMRYSFLEQQRATLSFNYSDIFNTMNFEFNSTTPYPAMGQFNWESNTWNIALSYRFGGGKYRALRRKQRDNNTKQGSGGFL
ncbi:outer membrane beta-barrel family protein [Hyunsoonleella pacifica]|uniref:TonB-dependent receptor n=1 Tax=Hyunsoonleella pacifica TaxID=1080224 RepID=A0A4Q9FJT4_9FLAO|nr:outer membrane beta-barrel family protein [Hyunsoonleella pacifica]TBN13813.1 TonB-dependent receptor [Hyunsoonleella pacifica]GGD25874.1 TonB-dependent receptor [Hyunsoonleella pacifica]